MPVLTRRNSRHFSVIQFVSLLVTAATLSLLATTARAQTSDLRLGVVLDQSTFGADIGRDYMAGARTYFDHINSQGGVNGRRITLIVKDDEGDPAKSVQLTKQLIEVDKVDALFGYVGDAGLAAVAADRSFRSAQIALYAPLSGESVANTPDNIFYLRPTYRDEVRHLISHFNRLGSTRFAIVASSSDFGTRLRANVIEVLNENKLPTASAFVMASDLKNLDAVAKQVLAKAPQVIIVAADTIEMAEFLKRFRALDQGINVVGFSTVNHRTLMELARRDFAFGALLTQVVPHPDLPRTRVQTEHLALMAKYREEPPSHVTLEGFVAAKGFVASISRGALTRSGILASLSGTQRIDVGGFYLAFTRTNDRGSAYVDLSFLRKDGRLVQ